MRSLRSKLLIAVSALIIILMSLNAWVLISSESKSLTRDVFRNARSYVSANSQTIGESYDVYFDSGFVRFRAMMLDHLEQSPEIKNLQIISYSGAIVYDAALDLEKIQVSNRIVSSIQLDRIQKIIPTLFTRDQKIQKLKTNPRGQVVDIIYPYLDENNQHSISIRYTLDYSILGQRIIRRIIEILIITSIGIALGLAIIYVIATSITQPLINLKEAVLGLARGSRGEKVIIQTQDEVGQLGSAFNQMSTELSAYEAKLIEKEKVEHEVKLAAEIQDELLPKTFPTCQHLEFAAAINPADDIGGDIYDLIPSDDQKVIFYVGDVTGHGVGSGVIAAITNALITGLHPVYHDIHTLMIQLNQVIKKKTKASMFVTMALGRWDDDKKELSYVTAGHDPIIYYSAREGRTRLLNKGGLALGMLPDISKTLKASETIQAESGDVFVIYSDGIPEAWSANKEMYGMERLQRLLNSDIVKGDAKSIQTQILNDVDDFRAGYEQMDDITILVLKVK